MCPQKIHCSAWGSTQLILGMNHVWREGGTKTKQNLTKRYICGIANKSEKKCHALIVNVINLSWKKYRAEGFACKKGKKINKQKAKKNSFKLKIASPPITYLNNTSPVLGGCIYCSGLSQSVSACKRGFAVPQNFRTLKNFVRFYFRTLSLSIVSRLWFVLN